MSAERVTRIGLRTARAGLPRGAAARPGRADPLAHLRARPRRRLGLDHDARRDPRLLADAHDRRRRGRDQHGARDPRSRSCSCAGRFRGKWLLDAIIDLPFAISPIVVGLALILVYGKTGWFGDALANAGIQVIFSWPGIVLATIFVTLPFVAREVAPVLREIGDEQEQAAATLGASRWQTFWRVTLPAIRWGVVYGVVLTTARAIGEFGAVSVVSGKIAGQTETLTLLVEKRFQNFDLAGAYAASALLAVIALVDARWR